MNVMEHVIKISGDGKLRFLKSSQYLGPKAQYPFTEDQDEAELWKDKTAAEAWCQEMWKHDDLTASVVPAHVPAKADGVLAEANEPTENTNEAPVRTSGKPRKNKAEANEPTEN